ncbi:MAG: hypothetical protein QOK29_3409 [Rhodospirillaceae bacterium]|nr:hypothetical protein [Rhodospirillaceae bacterium]
MKPLAPLDENTVHVVVDMQRLFAEDTGWQVPTIGEIVPNLRRLIDHRPERALYTRFVTPRNAAAAHGVWQSYYRGYPQVTLDRISPALFDLIEPLAGLAPKTAQIDKKGFSSFSAPDFATALDRLGAGTLVLTGVETDVCVFATALEAVERGHRVVIATDAVTGSSQSGHRAALDHVLPRYEYLIDLAPTSDIIAAWR